MANAAQSATERALQYVQRSARIRMHELRDNPGARTQGRQVRKSMNQGGHALGELASAAKPPLGWIWGNFFAPWQRLFPGEQHYNADINLRREYPPLSLLELQRLIDLGWLDTTRLIDLTALCRTRRYRCDPLQRQFGVQLTDEGMDIFASRVNLEVQWASETAIAAIERAGGRIRTAYYDPIALTVAVDPKAWFQAGEPIPARRTPPQDLIPYYTNARNRGYLAESAALATAEYELSQLMGYERSAKAPEGEDEGLVETKRPDQIFVGLDPGSLVSLADRRVFRPTHAVHVAHYGRRVETGTIEADRELRRARKGEKVPTTFVIE